MLDPVSALAIATSAYNMVKRGIEMGRELEDMGGQLSTWFGAVADVKSAEEEAKDPPIFKRLVSRGSVEQQALQALIARKKIEQQERELRELIVYRWGTEAYVEMMRDRARIKDTRTKAIEARKRKQRKFIANTFTIAAILALIGGIVAIIYQIIINLR
jgi:hypothetical protein